MNLWRVAVNPQTLRLVSGPERMTTDARSDSDIALSADGRKLAYTIRTQNRRIWSLPFNAATGQVKGAGQPVIAPGILTAVGDLSRDGRKISFWMVRNGKLERWVKSLDDGH